jgi:outer membrane protein assembly factor BamB
MSYHPIVVGNLVLVAGAEKIFGYQLDTGDPAWESPDGAIFKLGDGPPRNGARHTQLGAPRFTLSVQENLLFARVGSPVTSSVVESPFAPTGAVLKWFDLGAQAALVKDALPGDEKSAFDGVPLADGGNLYVAMRQVETGSRAQAHVACFDVQTGKLRWRRFVCAAETPGRSQMDEITHNLLSLDRGVLYFNTNLGAVAALSAKDGEVLWISRYPRSMAGDLNRTARHVYRDLNPCVIQQGRVFVAPADSERIFAFNAQTGDLLWGSAAGYPEDAVHVLGVLGDTLVASGDKLWGFDVSEGKVRAVWPDSGPPRGFGRGVLMGDEVIWPTRQELYHFRLDRRVVRDPDTGRAKEYFWWQNTRIDNLLQHSATGGNLVVAKDHLLIASSDTLYAFRRYTKAKVE